MRLPRHSQDIPRSHGFTALLPLGSYRAYGGPGAPAPQRATLSLRPHLCPGSGFGSAASAGFGFRLASLLLSVDFGFIRLDSGFDFGLIWISAFIC